MPAITLQFSTAEDSLANWASALIRRVCHSPFSHVDIVLEDGSMLGASNSPKAPCLRGNPAGVAVRPPNYQLFGTRRRMVIETDLTEIITAGAESQLGKPFDGTALHDFLLTSFPGVRDWRKPDAWFCADLVVWLFESCNYWDEPLLWPGNVVSPTDLFLLFQFDKNWSNRAAFWDPIPGLVLDPGEK